jgi:hypothetical protein
MKTKRTDKIRRDCKRLIREAKELINLSREILGSDAGGAFRAARAKKNSKEKIRAS